MADLRNTLRSLIKRESNPWMDEQPAWLGDQDGVVTTSTSGIYNARLISGKVIQVYNQARVAPDYDLPVRIGRRKEIPSIWQIIDARQAWLLPAMGGRVEYHHEQHEESGADRLNLDRKQIVQLTVRASDPDGFIVTVYGGLAGNVQVNTQPVDLSSYVITSGAKYVAIETDGNGTLSVQDGTVFAAPSLGTTADLPLPAVGKYTVAWVLLYDGQTELVDGDIVVPLPPLFNPASLPENLDDLADVNAPTPTDGQVLTWDDYAQEWIAAAPTGLGPLDDLTDVNVPSPADGQVLTWDAYAGNWIAGTPTSATPHAPGGRLTLTSGTPVTTAELTAQTSIYYTPYLGDLIPLWDGSAWTESTFAELTLALDATGGHTGYHQSGKNFDLFIANDSGTLRLCSGPAWSSDTARGTGAGTTELEKKNGIWTNKVSMTARFGSASGNTITVAANQGTYVGSFRASADGQTEISLKNVYLINYYHRRHTPLIVKETTDNWSTTDTTWHSWNSSTANRVNVLFPFDEFEVELYFAFGTQAPASWASFAGIALDATNTNSAQISGPPTLGSTGNVVPGFSIYRGYPGIGFHFLQLTEKAAGTGTSSFYGDQGIPSDLQFGATGWAER